MVADALHPFLLVEHFSAHTNFWNKDPDFFVGLELPGPAQLATDSTSNPVSDTVSPSLLPDSALTLLPD